MVYFYARVSTKDQNLARQLEAAKAFPKGIDRIFCDKMSGKNFDRPEYLELKSIVKAGDDVVVKELDRLGRNKEAIKDEIRWFRERGVRLRMLDIPTTLIDFQGQDWIADMINNILIEVLGAVAEQERIKIKTRQAEGMAAMKVVDGKRVSARTGRAHGRPNAVVDIEEARRLRDSGKSVAECCEALQISQSYWFKNVRGAI